MLNVQAVFERASALPEDRIINTFTFGYDAPAPIPAAIVDSIRDALDDFYFVNTAAGSSIRAYLANTLKSLSYRTYNSLTAKPRAAMIRPSVKFTVPPVNNALPAEVAMVASFYSARNLPRQRGRVFLGPLSQLATNAPASTDIDSRPATLLMTTVVQAMARLRDHPGLAEAPWSIYSVTDQVHRPVTAGWVDNAFDTQRRRGGKATTRSLWT